MRRRDRKDRLRLRVGGLRLKRARRKKTSLAHKALVGFAILAAVAAAGLLIFYVVQSQRLHGEQSALRKAYHEQATDTAAPSPEPTLYPMPDPVVVFAGQVTQAPLTPPVIQERQAASDRFIPLMRRNNDVVGWLTYPAFSEMDFVVVHRDNTHYLYRSFTGERNLAGTVFLEEGNSIRPRDANLILHGHNMADGTMFGKLARLLDPAILRREPLLRFDTLYQDALYVPYALTIFSINSAASDYFDVVQTSFNTPEAMVDYVNWLRAHSLLDFPTQIQQDDRLLTLVTCHGQDDDERLALALRAVRPGEDTGALRAQLETQIARR